MPKQWLQIDWDSCAYCGDDAVEVHTDSPATNPKGQQVYDGDDARCTNCGCFGTVFVDMDYPSEEANELAGTASVRWHDEPDCQCEWCKTHPEVLDIKDDHGTISDGFGSTWSAKCSQCGAEMQVVRPGDARCAAECYLKEQP